MSAYVKHFRILGLGGLCHAFLPIFTFVFSNLLTIRTVPIFIYHISYSRYRESQTFLNFSEL